MFLYREKKKKTLEVTARIQPLCKPRTEVSQEVMFDLGLGSSETQRRFSVF